MAPLEPWQRTHQCPPPPLLPPPTPSPRSVHAGRAWTGRQALKLGLIDGLGEMRDVMQAEYGEKARFLLCR